MQVARFAAEAKALRSGRDSAHRRVMLRHLLCAGAWGLAAAASASADILDVRLLAPESGAARVWIALEETPESIALREDADGAVVILSGASVSDRTWRLREGGPVSSLRARMEGGEAVLRLPAGFETAEAQRREGGVLLTFTGAARASAPAVAQADAGPVSRLASAEDLDRMRSMDRSRPEPAPETSEPDPESEPEREPVPQTAAANACEETGAAMEASPWDIAAMTAHGACLTEAGEPGEAQLIYERVLAFEPDQFDAALALAEIRAARGDRAGASALFETAQSSARTDGEALAVRAAAEAALGG